MRKFIQISILTVLLFLVNTSVAQNTVQNDVDFELKQSLYKKYKNEVRAYDRKAFDDLFFAFFAKQSGKTILTKEEFYTYTVKIAIYSEKYGLLYKKEKEQAKKTKEMWLSKQYSEYLKGKNL